MEHVMRFIKATEGYNTFDAPVAAPYLRRVFSCAESCVAAVRVAADGYYDAPCGRIRSRWRREGETIVLSLALPDALNTEVILPEGYAFADGTSRCAAKMGDYTVRKV